MLPLVTERKERALRAAETPVMVRAFRTICWAEEERDGIAVDMKVCRKVEIVDARDGILYGTEPVLVTVLDGGSKGVETDSVEAVEARMSGSLTGPGAFSLTST